jgi:curved DNA-binding protein CbpA
MREIKKAYHAKAIKYHLDKTQDLKDIKKITATTEKFKKLNEAYEILGNDEKRKQYNAEHPELFTDRSFVTTNNAVYSARYPQNTYKPYIPSISNISSNLSIIKEKVLHNVGENKLLTIEQVYNILVFIKNEVMNSKFNDLIQGWFSKKPPKAVSVLREIFDNNTLENNRDNPDVLYKIINEIRKALLANTENDLAASVILLYHNILLKCDEMLKNYPKKSLSMCQSKKITT